MIEHSNFTLWGPNAKFYEQIFDSHYFCVKGHSVSKVASLFTNFVYRQKGITHDDTDGKRNTIKGSERGARIKASDVY